MLHSLAARALLMHMDEGVDYHEAILWVVRRIPSGLKNYYINKLCAERYMIKLNII